jgi:hypothetical protein
LEDNENQNKEIDDEKKEQNEYLSKIKLALFAISIILIILIFQSNFVNNLFEFLFRKASTMNFLIIKFSLFITLILCSLYIFLLRTNEVKILIFLSFLIFIGASIIGLSLSSFFGNVLLELKQYQRSVTIFFCRLTSEINGRNPDECEKDYKKIGSYNGLEISFGFVKNPQSLKVEKDTSDVFAGKPYNLQLALINRNTAPKDQSYDNTYDIKINEITVKVSGRRTYDKDSPSIVYKSLSVNENLRGGAYKNVIINFESTPNDCSNTMYFEATAITEQNSKGVFSFYVNPNLDETEKIDFTPEIFTTPGPLDVVSYTVPEKILNDQTEFTLVINAKNFMDGTVKIKNVKIVFGVDYIDIKNCNFYGFEVKLKKCNYEKSCYEFSLDDVAYEYEFKKDKTINFYCNGVVNKDKYNEKDSTVTGSVYLNYYYKVTATTSKSAVGCLGTSKTISTIKQNDAYCKEPDICRRECPEGYIEVPGKCSQIDSVCCRNIESYSESDLVKFHPTSGIGYFTSCFGWRTKSYFHSGIDLGIVHGSPIYAIQSGKVVRVGYDKDGFGNFLIIEHEINGEKYYSLYGHLECSGVKVQNGQYVEAGDIIGYSGGDDECKGTSTGAHLHFEIRKGSNDVTNSVNPCLYIKNCGDCSSTATTCQRYKEYDRVDQTSGNCDDPLT